MQIIVYTLPLVKDALHSPTSVYQPLLASETFAVNEPQKTYQRRHPPLSRARKSRRKKTATSAHHQREFVSSKQRRETSTPDDLVLRCTAAPPVITSRRMTVSARAILATTCSNHEDWKRYIPGPGQNKKTAHNYNQYYNVVFT